MFPPRDGQKQFINLADSLLIQHQPTYSSTIAMKDVMEMMSVLRPAREIGTKTDPAGGLLNDDAYHDDQLS